jgi:ribosome recycling factor
MPKKKHTRKPRQPGQHQQPHWQGIETLWTFATPIDGMLEASQEQYETLQEARPKPHVLDDSTVERVIEVFTKQIADLWLFDEQLKRWQVGQLTDEQRAEVARLVEQMAKLRKVDEDVLALAKELSKGTIEKVMAKSDAELGLEFLIGIFQEKP